MRVKIGTISLHMPDLDSALALVVKLRRKGHPAVLTV
jgi:hypothetical protein